MSKPIVLISHLRVKEGKFDVFKESSQETFQMMEASKPGTLVHIGFANGDRTQVSFVHVFPDAKAVDDHMEGVASRVNKAVEFLEALGYEIYGAPSEQVMEMMEQFAGSEIPLKVEPEYFGGYMRLASS